LRSRRQGDMGTILKQDLLKAAKEANQLRRPDLTP